MKNKLIIIFILYFITTSHSYVEDTWSKIENKTWFSLEPGMGSQIVFLKNKFSEKKAIFQLHGSGCYVVATKIYNVEIIDNLIKLTSTDPVLKERNENQYSEYHYSDKNKRIEDFAGKINYHIISEQPLVYKLCSKKVDIESLKNDTITINDFRK